MSKLLGTFIPKAIAHNKSNGDIVFLESTRALQKRLESWLETCPTADIEVYVPTLDPSLHPTEMMRARCAARGEDRYRRLVEADARRAADDARAKVERLRRELDAAVAALGEHAEFPNGEE